MIEALGEYKMESLLVQECMELEEDGTSEGYYLKIQNEIKQ